MDVSATHYSKSTTFRDRDAMDSGSCNEGILVYRGLGPHPILHLSSIVDNQLKWWLTNLDITVECQKSQKIISETEMVLDKLLLRK